VLLHGHDRDGGGGGARQWVGPRSRVPHPQRRAAVQGVHEGGRAGVCGSAAQLRVGRPQGVQPMHQAEVRRAAGQPQRPHQGAPDAVWVVWHRRAVLLAPQGVVAPQPVLPQVQGAGLAPVQLWVLLPGEEADVEIEAG